MNFFYQDFNNANALFEKQFKVIWEEVAEALTAVPVNLKASDQKGREGNLIFNPVGTNMNIKKCLQFKDWGTNVRMPSKFNFLGKDVDFVKDHILAEVQFSNYPFLLNNVIRSELLCKSQISMPSKNILGLIMITKAKIFPASNSTLYYEQAVKQLSELSRNKVIDIPIRLVGISIPIGVSKAMITTYHTPRYSRTSVECKEHAILVTQGRTADGVSKISKHQHDAPIV